MNENQNLSIQDKRDIVIQAGMNAIPYVGGSLCSLYFGVKQERRFKRIEAFYQEIQVDLERFKDQILDIKNLNSDEIVGLIEEINEGVENDFLSEKMNYFKNCFFNILTKDPDDEYRKRKYFIHMLSMMGDADISLLAKLFAMPLNHGYRLQSDDLNFAEFNSSLEKLKSYGFVHSSLNSSLEMGVNWGEISLYSISTFGRDFCKFCLENVYIEKNKP